MEKLDRVPLIGRVRIGAKMARTFQAMQEGQTRRSFLAFDPSGNGFVFLYDYDHGDTYGTDGEQFVAQVAAYGSFRQHHALEAGLDRGSATLAIGVLHHPERGRRYVFTLTVGEPPDLPIALRRNLEQEFGVFTGSAIHATDPSST